MKLLIILTLIPLTTFCQSKDTINKKKIEIGLIFSPDYCYRSLQPDPSTQWSEGIASRRDSFEIPKFGYTTGAGVLFSLTNKITLETGLLFSDKGEKTKYHHLTTGSPDPLLGEKIRFVYHYLYLDVPVKANYFVLMGKVKLFLSAGISANIFLTQKTSSIIEYSDGSTARNNSTGFINDFYSKVNLAAIAGVGINYGLTSRLNLRIEPVYRRSITSITASPSSIKGYLYSIGINTGIYYRL